MTENSGDQDTVNIEVEINEAGKPTLKANVPARLVEKAGKGLASVLETGFAGFAPEFYDRSRRRKLAAQLERTAVDELRKRIAAGDVDAVMSALLHSILHEKAQLLETRAEVIDGAVAQIENTSGSTGESSDRVIENAFLEQFWNALDKVSREDVREIFTRILAGEIIKPGSFSGSTLNLLTVLHPKQARDFERLCNMTFKFGDYSFVIVAIPPSEGASSTPNPVSLSSAKFGDQLLDFGIDRNALFELRTAGLIRSGGDEEFPDLTDFYEATGVEFAGRRARFKFRPEDVSSEGGWELQYATKVISLTNTGMELRSVIPLAPATDYADSLLKCAQRAGLSFEMS